MLEDTIVEEDIHPTYVSAGETDIGRLRATNQDAFAELTEAGLWVVADGMGGYRDGDVASRMVCEALQGLPSSLGLGDAQRRRHPQAVAVHAALADEQPVPLGRLEDGRRGGRVRRAAVARIDDLQPHHEPAAADLAEDGHLAHQRCEPAPDALAHAPGVAL